MGSFRYKQWRIVLISAFFALLPVAGGNVLIERYATSRVADSVNNIAASAMGRIDFILESLATTLDKLELAAVKRCTGSDILKLQQVVQEARFAREIWISGGVFGSEGRCTSTGFSPAIADSEHSKLLEHSALDSRYALRSENPDNPALGIPRITLSKTSADGARYYARVPTALLMPERLMLGQDQEYALEVNFVDGTSILLYAPSHIVPRAEAPVEREALSFRYPVRVVARVVASDINREAAGLLAIARLTVAAIGLLGGLLVYTFLRRRGSDPLVKMQDALANNEFIPYYQPIVNLRTGALAGCEVLVRWRLPTGELVPPGAFIDIAEHSGFIFPLTLAIMNRAASDLGAVYSVRPSLKCGFNLCAQHFTQEAIVDEVHDIFVDSAMDPNQVYLEVTERDPLPDLDRARRIISHFQSLGMKVALDDVGTGHGGMSYLLKLGVDIMKIDKIFIDGLGQSAHSAAIIESLLELARQMKLEVVAEGVETAVQLEELRKRGVSLAQGYFFAQPMPASSYVSLIEAMVSAEAPPGSARHVDPQPDWRPVASDSARVA